ncbi:MAG: signal peptidase I [Candidatus Saccharimonadales bacterium]|jgi:signal peptidase I
MKPHNDEKPPQLIPSDIYPADDQRHTSKPTPAKPQPAPSIPSPSHASQAHRHKNRANWHSILSTVVLFLLAVIIALCIAAFVVQSYQVDGQSMETTLQNNNRLIVDKIPRTWARITGHDYIPARGDIVIFNQSGLLGLGSSGQKQLIKRVIGLPGDRVVIQNGHITIYNQAHPSGFNPDKTVGYHLTATNTPDNIGITLGPRQIFVCGDNRPDSEDSRFFGPIDAKQIVGKLILRILPANEIEKF